MSALTEETARELIEALQGLAFVVKGLTGVLIDDRDAEEEEEEGASEGEGSAPATTYMDGSTVGG